MTKDRSRDFQKYADMLELPHHVSATHPPMDAAERAAQFAPFAALTGYGDAVRERARLTKARPQLDEEEMEQINRKLLWLRGHPEEKPEIAVTYFLPDRKKEGGALMQVRGRLKKILEGKGRLLMEDGRSVPIRDLVEIHIVDRSFTPQL